MPQSAGLPDILTIKEALRFFAYLNTMSESKFIKRYALLKNILDLPPDNSLVQNCSGGEKKRISLAAAMVHDPKFLVLDE
jgi:ABC-2 type transport system ATP-binding protein